MDSPTLIHFAKLISVPLPFALAGYTFTLSQSVVSNLYDHKAEIATPIFEHILASSGPIVVPGTLLASAATAYLAYVDPAQRNTWGMAAASLFALLPYTILRLFPGSANRLTAISKNTTLQEKSTANLEHRQLMMKWGRQNYVRAALLFMGGVFAVQANMAA